MSMNYELHDWQPFPEENTSLGEFILSLSVCVAAINANGVTEKANMPLFAQTAQSRCCKAMLGKQNKTTKKNSANAP